MKRAFVLGISLLFGIITLWAQVPQHFSYQAVIRNNDGSATASQKVSVRVSILQGSESGTVMYTETHSVKSNPNGLITLQIGDGFPVNGSFSAIDWQHGPFFLKTEVDPNGGNNLSLVSVQQLLSVPYALYAEKAGSVKDAVDKGYVDNQDNRLKDYVDSLLALFPSVDTSRIGAPVVVTDSAVVYRHYAKVSGKVLSDGGELIMSRGFCYGTKPNPTISDNYVLLGNGKGEFSGAITGLQDSVTYYVRAFATSRYGTAYGAQRSVSTNSKNNRTFGIFAVSDSTYVRFAPGYLQYSSKTKTSQFSKNQIDDTASGIWSDHFTYSDFSSNMYNVEGNWRFLTEKEWQYLVSRKNKIIFVDIEGEKGVVFLPDNWDVPLGFYYGIDAFTCWYIIDNNNQAAKVRDNKHKFITREQWDVLEASGAVFLNENASFWLQKGIKNSSGTECFCAACISGIPAIFRFFQNLPGDRLYMIRLVQDVKK